MKTKAGYHYFRTLRQETARLHEYIRKVHADYPELKVKEISTLCFCGEYTVEQALKQTN